MIADVDAYRAAELLIDQHGEEAAETLAIRRVDFFLEEGDTLAAAVWSQILVAMEELRRRMPEGEAAN